MRGSLRKSNGNLRESESESLEVVGELVGREEDRERIPYRVHEMRMFAPAHILFVKFPNDLTLLYVRWSEHRRHSKTTPPKLPKLRFLPVTSQPLQRFRLRLKFLSHNRQHQNRDKETTCEADDELGHTKALFSKLGTHTCTFIRDEHSDASD